MEAWRGNTLTLIEELQTWRKRGLKVPGSTQLPPEDAKRAEALGLGSRPGNWTFLSAQGAMRDLAAFVIQGQSPFFGEVEERMREVLGIE